MSLRKMIDRRLVLMVASPIARALLSLLVGYFTAKGVPPNLLEQFVAAIGVTSMVVFNITWELIERKRVVGKASQAGFSAARSLYYPAYDPVRDRFDEESA